MEIDETEVTERLLDAIDAEIRNRGRGTATAVARHLGMIARGWWRLAYKRRSVTLEQCRRICDFLRLDFSGLACAADGPPIVMIRPNTGVPPLVDRAAERVRQCVGGALKASDVARLEELRFTDARVAFIEAKCDIEAAPFELIPDLLGVAGSAAHRLLDPQSYGLIYGALWIAKREGVDAPVGALYQRASYLYGSRGDYTEALRITRFAIQRHIEQDHPLGYAKAMVDQGLWLSRCGRYRESEKALFTALPLLPVSEHRNRSAVWELLALKNIEEGAMDSATVHLERATTEANYLEPDVGMKIRWIHARMFFEQRRYHQAARVMESVVDHFIMTSQGDAVLAACDLVSALLHAGELEAARQAIDGLIPLLNTLRHYPLISAALLRLAIARNQGLRLEVIQSVRKDIAAAQKIPGEWPLSH